MKATERTFRLDHMFINIMYHLFSEQLGSQVEWDPDTQTVVIKDNGTGALINVTIGSDAAIVNGGMVQLPLSFIFKA